MEECKCMRTTQIKMTLIEEWRRT